LTAPDRSPASPQPRLGAIALRAGLLALVWLVLAGAGTADLVVGAPAVLLAVWASLVLLPPSATRIDAAALFRFAGRFLASSLAAGFDVMRRAFDPRLPLAVGFVPCPCTIAPGPGRDAFRAVMTLQPGSLPVGDDGGDAMLLHCLDVGAAHADAFRRAEAGFRSLTERSRHA
jgi:multicomponent Na+:H+ antiporter subunit E